MKAEKPLVSVIIPSYNRADLIERAIRSAMEQTYDNLEIIVVNDGSADNTDEIVSSIKDERIKLISLEKNGGLSNARNTGIKAATGEFVAFLDSDDEWDKNKTEKQINLFLESKDKRLGAVFCYCYENDEYKNIITKRDKDEDFLRGDLHKEFLKGYCPPSPTLFIIKRRALEEVGLFDKKIKNFEDLDLYIRVSKNYTFDYVDDYLATKYDHIGDRLATNIDSRLKGIKVLMRKWKQRIIEVHDWNTFNDIRNTRLRALVSANLKGTISADRKKAVKCIGILLSIKELNPRLYIKAVLSLIFGVKTVNKTIEKWNKK